MSVPRLAGPTLRVLCLLALVAPLAPVRPALAADDAEPDAASAEGRVLSAGGSPLAGADVALYPCLDARAAAALALAGRAATPAARGKTGADGRFVLAAPKPGVYVARIETKGTVPLTTAPLALVEPTALDDARLERDAGLVVAVADGAKPAAGAIVRLRAEAARGPVPFWRAAEQWATTDAKGEARFALAARAAGRVAALLPGRGAAARDAVHGPRATLTVASAPPTAVEVVAAGDLPAANALLLDARLDLPLGFVGADGRGEARFASLGAAPRLRVVAADGATAETTLVGGASQTTQTAGAKGGASQTTLAGRESQTTQTAGAKGGASQTTLAAGGRRRIVLAAPRVAQGRVVDAETRRPLAGAVAWRAGAEAEAAASDDAGAYKIVGAAPGDEILFRAAGALDADVRVRADGSLPTAALRGAAVVEGRVTAAGQPLAGVEVIAAATPTGPPRRPFGAFRGPRPGQPGGRRPRAASGADGAFRVRGLDPTENWTLEARAAGFAPAKAEAGPLAPRRTRGGVVLALQRGGAIAGKFVDPQEKPVDAVVVEIAAAPTMARGPMPFGPPADRSVSWRALSDRQGEFRVADLPAGRFELTTQRRGFAPERRGGLAVEAGATLDLGAIALGQGAAVEGRVAAADGTPIAGAEIRALPSEIGRAMMRRRGGPETEPDAVSDALGAFVLADQKPGAVLALSVRREGYADLDVPGVAVPPNAPLAITLVPASRVEGTVVDADKKPIAGARVAAAVQQGGGGPRGFGPRRALDATADEDGRFVFDDVPAGIATLTASAPGRKDGKLEGVRVVAGKNVTGLSIALDAGAWLVGRVLLADGTAAIGAAVAQVGAQSAAAGGPGGGGAAATTSSAIADGDGLYRLDGLGAGAIDVEATLEGAQRAVKHVELRTGENQLDLQLSGGQTISGSVVDDGGAPVPLATVSLSGSTPFGGRAATADDQGQFAMTGLSDGDYALVARRDGYTTSDATAVKVQGAPVQGVEIKLPRGGAIVGTITGLAADKLSGVTVVAMQQGLGGGASASPDSSGAFRIDNCRYGDWTVTARRDEGASATTHVTVSAATPEPRADLSFGAGATLSGAVVDGSQPLAGATVFARALGAAAGGAPGLESGTSATDADGRFKIEGLAAGSYNVSVLRMADGLDFSTQVDLSADRDVTLRAPRTTVGGRVLDSADRGALAGATAELTPSAAMGGRGGGMLRATTGDDGRFAISNVAEGTWTLAVRLDGYAAARQTVSVAESGAPDAEVLLQRTSGLALRVTLATGAAPDAVEALLLDESGRVVAGGRYDTGEGGLVTIGDAPQGTYALVVQADGAAAVTTTATAPGGPLAILLPAPCHLDVEVADLAGKDTAATLSVYDANGTAWRRPMMRNAPASFPMVLGRASLDGLPPGTWTIVATTAAGGRWQGTATTTAAVAAKAEL